MKFEIDLVDLLRRHGYCGEENPQRVVVYVSVGHAPLVKVFFNENQ